MLTMFKSSTSTVVRWFERFDWYTRSSCECCFIDGKYRWRVCGIHDLKW